MPKIITARFREAGIPQTGLSPTIDIYNASTDVLIINDGAMTEIADGLYKYVFTEGNGYSPYDDYIYTADGTVTITSPYERYQEGACCASEPEQIANIVWESDYSSYTDINTMGGRANATFSDVGQLLLDVADVQVVVDTILKFHTNRTKIDSVAKTLTIYDDDGVTPIKVFTLRDGTGTPSVDEVCERDPV